MRWKIAARDLDSPGCALAGDRALQWWWNVDENAGLKNRSLVIVHLQNPREKIWGALITINAFGMIVRGIDVYSFDDWSRSVANQTENMGLSTMFVPMMRVEKIVLDESYGGYKSFSEQFRDRVGHDVREYLGIPPEETQQIVN